MVAEWVCFGSGVGEWISNDGQQRGDFRVYADLHWATLYVYNGPEHLDDENPSPLQSYSFRLEDDGRLLRISFAFDDIDCRGEVFIDVCGGMNGSYKAADGTGRYIGTSTVELCPYNTRPPRPKDELPPEPSAISWAAPDCVLDGSVMLLGVGGASRSGKGLLTAAIARTLRTSGVMVRVVHQDRFVRCSGSYVEHGERENTEVGMFETPSSILWRDFTRAISAAAEDVLEDAEDRGEACACVVVVEGFLLYWMDAINQALQLRIFLRASRDEVFWRRQQSKPLPESFLEHVFWPAYLAYGQPQAPVHEIEVLDGEQEYPVPNALLAKALQIIRDHGPLLPSAPALEPERTAPEVEPQHTVNSVEERVVASFQRIDPEQSGTIGRADFCCMLKRLDAVTWNDSKIEKLLSIITPSNSDSVEYMKFIDWVFSACCICGSFMQGVHCVVFFVMATLDHKHE